MTQEEKQLLLKDICARLPYRVMIKSVGENKIIGLWDLKDVDNLPLPYLRPMSSMTEEERDDYKAHMKREQIVNVAFYYATHESYDWLNEHHFDYRGLIKKELALEAPEDMYKTEKK